MKIGELAKATQTPTETIRFYEREGLLPAAPRTASNYRRYGPAEVERLGLIRRCRALDMNLAEIRALLAIWDAQGPQCGEVNALLDAHLGHVSARIQELEALRDELQALRQRCAAASHLAECGILQELLHPPVAAQGLARRHGGSPCRG